MEIRFIKASPCKNTTIFFYDEALCDGMRDDSTSVPSLFDGLSCKPHHTADSYRGESGFEALRWRGSSTPDIPPSELRGRIAAAAMEPSALCAEQVGWIVPPRDEYSVARLEMAGGEFCGNATLALGALAVLLGLAEPEEDFFVECSGADEPLRVSARRTGSTRFFGSLSMPPPLAMKPATILSKRGGIVHLPGIVHFCTDEEVSPDDFEALSDALASGDYNGARESVGEDAYGVIACSFTARGACRITPFVTVPQAKSRVFEQACGSGSFALASWLSRQGYGESFSMEQPGGTILARAGERGGISTEVTFTCSGTFFWEDR